MKQQDLIDRYVYAVVRHLPRKQAEDIDKELHGLIEDMLTTRCGDRPVEEKDILVVLTELGTPQELAAQYCDSKESCLIGQPYYSQYKMVLKWVLVAVICGMTIAFAIEIGISAVQGSLKPAMLAFRLVDFIRILLECFLGIIGAMTLLYAIIQRKGINLSDSLGLTGSLKELPPVPQKKEKISKADAITGIVFSVIFLFLFLAFPQAVCVVFKNGEELEVFPFFEENTLRSYWFLFVGIGVCGIVEGAFQLIEGRYTLRLAAVNGICNLFSILFAVFLAIAPDIVNPLFLEKLSIRFTGELSWLGTELVPRIFPLFILLVIFFSALDFAATLYRALKYRT